MDCLFCKINAGSVPTNIVYEDDVVTCFLDAFPDSNGHLLIIPKQHTLDLFSISDETLAHIMKVAQKMGKLLMDRLGCDGIVLVQNNGDAQQIKHYHLHLKPTYQKPTPLLKPEEILARLK